MTTSIFYITAGIILAIVVFDKVFFYWKKLPPGPIRLPILGNVLQAPTSHEWLHWATFKDIYGSISSMVMIGRPIILLNDLQTILDLMETKSRTYAGRPVLPLAGELVGWNRQLIISPYNEHFRLMRKLMAKYIGTKSSLTVFYAIQENHTHLLMARILEEPERFLSSIRLCQGAFFLRISHGYIVNQKVSDPLITLIERAAKEFYIATKPGAWLVDVFPFLMKLPTWFPGTSFRRVAEEFKKTNEAQSNIPHEWVKQQMARGTALPSFTSQMLQEPVTGPEEDAIKHASNFLYGGGTDTVTATLASFFLAMALFPHVQRKAQEEIDGVTASLRLPNFGDREKLPYVSALMKELLRWHVAGPMGIPHSCLEDDEYKGYVIPKGAIVLANIWQISRDPQHHTNPEIFRPERYLGDNPELDPHIYAFGFGRRRCPGIELADASVYIAVAMTLAVFDITPIRNPSTGQVDMPEHQYISGTVCHPKPFKCDITPRFPTAAVLIRSIHDQEQLPPSQL
ncbi:cytochrome P450 oxidoreductase [Hysterangium stoloniferum]|nr:cytochrome P450 oxidoreductase [Hysterangium stoloniferum]